MMEHLSQAVEYFNSLPTGLLAGVLVVLVTLYYWPIWDRHRYPPGPFPWPFVGNIPLVLKHTKDFQQYIYDNRDKFGEVFTLQLNIPTVWLNSPEAIYDGFVKNADSLSTRPKNEVFSKEFGVKNGGGVVNSPDGVWQIHRRHLLAVFKEQGVGKTKMEDVILQEIKYFHEALEGHNEEPVDIRDLLKQSVSNIATHIAFGKRFEYNDEQLFNLQFENFVAVSFKTRPVPMLRHLPFDPTGWQKEKRCIVKTLEFIKDQIAEHKRTIDYDNPRDFIDSFLVQQQQHEDKEENHFTDGQLISVLLQIYIAGTDTTSSVLYWAFLYMVVQPDIQEKIHLEIENKIGERSPVYADRANMPYTMCVVTELLRVDVAQRSVPHIAKQDVVVQGHTIPKGTTVVANLFASTHNELLYDDPGSFNPSRFLDDDGNFSKPESKQFTPFGIGRRSCPGESLARMELFLFLTCTLQKYRVLLGQEKQPSTDGEKRFTYTPVQTYQIKFQKRL